MPTTYFLFHLGVEEEEYYFSFFAIHIFFLFYILYYHWLFHYFSTSFMKQTSFLFSWPYRCSCHFSIPSTISLCICMMLRNYLCLINLFWIILLPSSSSSFSYVLYLSQNFRISTSYSISKIRSQVLNLCV